MSAEQFGANNQDGSRAAAETLTGSMGPSAAISSPIIGP